MLLINIKNTDITNNSIKKQYLEEDRQNSSKISDSDRSAIRVT